MYALQEMECNQRHDSWDRIDRREIKAHTALDSPRESSLFWWPLRPVPSSLAALSTIAEQLLRIFIIMSFRLNLSNQT